MPIKEQVKQEAEQAKQTHEQRSRVISNQLMQALGRPTTLYRVQVRHLWNNHYRANVFVGATVAVARIAHSYFLMADEEGNIVTSIPDILREGHAGIPAS